jgi:hypothetical protein
MTMLEFAIKATCSAKLMSDKSFATTFAPAAPRSFTIAGDPSKSISRNFTMSGKLAK